MKRIISVILVCLFSLSLCACGSNPVQEVEKQIEDLVNSPYSEKAAKLDDVLASYNALDDKQKEKVENRDQLKQTQIYVLAQSAYNNINTAYEIIEVMGSDIYEAWRIGVFNSKEVKRGKFSYLASTLSLSEKELIEGAKYYVASLHDQMAWETLSKDQKARYDENVESVFYLLDDVFSACVLVTSNAYVENGKTKQVEELLTSAKAQMKEMSQKYSDYEHYSNLKEYFTSVSAFFDFCKSPKGSYEQAIETMNDYRNTARELKNDLAFIFEE